MKLKNIATLHFGHYAKPQELGEVMYLQAKNFDEAAIFHTNIDTWLNLDDKSRGHLLQDGDILLVGKGMRNFAWMYTKEVGPAVASSIFYVIRIHNNKARPEYLTILFNSQQYQNYFQALGAGSSIPSIRKSELMEIEIPLPHLNIQHEVAEIDKLHKKEMALTTQIATQKNNLFQVVLNKLIYC